MIQFEHPWFFLLLLAQPLVWWLSPAHRTERDSVQIPFMRRLTALTRQTPSRGAVVLRRYRFITLLVPLWWGFLVAGMARPVWVAPPIEKTESTRDMMLLVDLSGSMATEDFTNPAGARVSRLDAVKSILLDFVGRRENDRMALIVFGDAPYLQAPFTRDHKVLNTLISQTEPRMAGPQTAIGDAIGLAIKHFESSKSEQRTAVLLTDGNDTGSKVPPKKAAEIAAQKRITIHAIAVGDPRAVGEEKMDIDTLQAISQMTGGSFFRAEDGAGLESVYRKLDEIEPEKIKTITYRPRYPLFQWPVGIALASFFLCHFLVAAAVRVRRVTGEAPSSETSSQQAEKVASHA